jgi:phosphoribosylformimino-5-aminoimidazole carboxamide ribotide isomerase
LFERFSVIPAIDLKGGDVVRLMHGEMDRATVYGKNPAEIARNFEEQGAALIHVVDLDGAIAGEPKNIDAVRAIRAAVRCAIDVSGGLRTIESIRAVVAAGADRISIGSAAFLDPALVRRACQELPDRVFGAIDAREGHLAIKGWIETSQLTVGEAIARFKEAGAAAVTVTDISRDGTQIGVDALRMAAVASAARIPLIASGGVASLEDIAALAAHFNDGVVGVIVGRALYEGNLTLAEAIAAAA